METTELNKNDIIIIKKGTQQTRQRITEKRTLILLDDQELKKFRALASGNDGKKTNSGRQKKEMTFTQKGICIAIVLAILHFFLTGGKF